MGRHRRIVPDASVMVPAFFPETLDYRGTEFDISKRARQLADAVLKQDVVAIAPEHLIYEFTKCAHRKIDEGIDPEQAAGRVNDFLYLWGRGVRTEPMSTLADTAWKLSTENRIAPPDSWYLACALIHGAELWISHRQHDGFADKAQRVHEQVFVLTEDHFRKPRRAQ